MIALQEKSIKALKKEEFDLVDGEFSANEALEIIDDLYARNINFHEIKSFSQLIRYEAKDEATLARISELKEAKEQARKLLQAAREAGRSLRVSSTISIEII
jgi:tyrosyl-tRNA synthetase